MSLCPSATYQSQQLYKPASRGLSAIADLLVCSDDRTESRLPCVSCGFSNLLLLQLFNFNIHPTPKEKTVVDNYNTIILMLNDYSRDRNLCKSIVVPGHILLTILNSVGLLQKQNINIKAILRQ